MIIQIEKAGKQLILFGSLLFLLGLLQGALIPMFTNPRMALSAHLAAVQSGLALMVFGVIWSLVDLDHFKKTLARYAAILSMYLVWLSITLAAINGASEALPMAGAGFTATQFGELVVNVLVYTGAGLGVLSAVLMVFGLYKNFKQGV